MWAYALILDAEELAAAIDDLTERINAPFRRSRPFRIVTEEEPIGETIGGNFVRFRLVVTSEFSAKNERAAWKFTEQMRAAATEIEKMNEANYVLMPPPSRRMGPPR